jgi:hypothetical protein
MEEPLKLEVVGTPEWRTAEPIDEMNLTVIPCTSFIM